MVTVNDDVRTDQVEAVRVWKLWRTMPHGRIAPDELQGVIDLVPVDVKLALAPRLTRVAQDVDEVLPRPWR